MRILWFTNTPSNASEEFGYRYMGGGWIRELEKKFILEGKGELGICFFYSGAEYKTLPKDKVIYYGMPFQQESSLKRLIHRHKAILDDEQSNFISAVLEDFKPDIIHVFGTEMGYGKLLINKFQKVVFHLQGLIAPYSEVYFPPQITKQKKFFGGSLKDMIRGLTWHNKYMLFKKREKREIEIVCQWKYFMGRTEWDKNYIKLLNPNAKYFHCDELLRGIFFDHVWEAPIVTKNEFKVTIGTTINQNIYKGLDVIYKVIPLLKNFSIEWKIFGIEDDSLLNKTIKNSLGINQTFSNLKFYGQTVAKDLIKELKNCHFFVHPSYIDNSPNSVCEAMLLGMPVLSSSVGGVKSLITHNENGFLFNPYDKYDLAGLLGSLINNYDKALCAGREARLTALKRHSSDDTINVLNGIYNKIYND